MTIDPIAGRLGDLVPARWVEDYTISGEAVCVLLGAPSPPAPETGPASHPEVLGIATRPGCEPGQLDPDVALAEVSDDNQLTLRLGGAASSYPLGEEHADLARRRGWIMLLVARGPWDGADAAGYVRDHWREIQFGVVTVRDWPRPADPGVTEAEVWSYARQLAAAGQDEEAIDVVYDALTTTDEDVAARRWYLVLALSLALPVAAGKAWTPPPPPEVPELGLPTYPAWPWPERMPCPEWAAWQRPGWWVSAALLERAERAARFAGHEDHL